MDLFLALNCPLWIEFSGSRLAYTTYHWPYHSFSCSLRGLAGLIVRHVRCGTRLTAGLVANMIRCLLKGGQEGGGVHLCPLPLPPTRTCPRASSRAAKPLLIRYAGLATRATQLAARPAVRPVQPACAPFVGAREVAAACRLRPQACMRVS